MISNFFFFQMIEEGLENFKIDSDYLKRIKTEHLMSKNVRKCSVSKCTYEGERGLFEIPKDDRRNIWLKNLGLNPSAKGLVCYNHFEDYHVSKFMKNSKPSFRLLPGAVPKENHLVSYV